MLHRYYQASRTPNKLNYLIELIWERLQVDRNQIEKTVKNLNLNNFKGD